MLEREITDCFGTTTRTTASLGHGKLGNVVESREFQLNFLPFL